MRSRVAIGFFCASLAASSIVLGGDIVVNVVQKENMASLPNSLYWTEGILGVVNGDIIIPRAALVLAEPSMREARQNLKGQELAEKMQEIAAAAINKVVTRILILQKAKSDGLTIPDSAIDERLQQAINAQSAGDQTSFTKSLAARGYTMKSFCEGLRDDIMVEEMREKAIAGATSAAEEERMEREWLNQLQKKAYIKLIN